MAVLEMEEGRMQVCRDGAPIYDIVLEDSFDRLPEEMERLGSQGRKLCIVTDSNVAPLYLEAVEKLLSGCFSQVTSYVFPAGEEHKNLDTVKRVYEHLIQNRFDRKDWLAALGGGHHRRPVRVHCGHLFKRRGLYPDPHHPAFPGGFQHRRKDRRGF